MAARINKNKVIAAAQKYVQKGQYDRAIREYRKVVDEDPRDVRIWLKIGDLHAKKGAGEEAIATYLKVAEFYSEQGFYLKAVAVYKQVLKLNPSLVDVNLKLAGLYKQLGLLNDAMQQYELVSNHYHQQGRTKDALAAVRQIVDLDPENVASRIKLAELYSKEQMREEAIEEFAKAADFLRAGNRIDDFIKVAERLVYHQADNLVVTRELANLYLQRRDPRRALQKLQLAFKADPRDEGTLEMLAQAFEDLGQVAKTVSVLRELAHIHAENGQEAKRIETFRRILTLAPEDEEAQQALGQMASAQPAEVEVQPRAPNPPSAPYEPPPPPPPPSADLQRVPDAFEEVAPTFADERPTSAYQAKQEPSPAPRPLPPRREPSVEVVEETARVLTEAEVYIKYGLHDKAIDHLRSVFHQDPYNVEVRLKLRDLYVQVGRFTEAAEELYVLAKGMAATDRRDAAQHLNEALELDAGHRAAQELLSQLEQSSAGPLPEQTFTDYDQGGGGYDRGRGGYDRDGDEYDLVDVTDSAREDTFTDGYADSAIHLDVDDIVEEIPIDSADLLVEEVEAEPADPGAPPLETLDDLPGDLPVDDYSGDDYSGEYVSGSGVIEVYGETTDALGMGMPSSDVIPLSGAADEVSDLRTSRVVEQEPAGSDGSVEDDLEEADFFIQQNLFGEARSILDELAKRHPHNPLVMAKLADLDELERRASAALDVTRSDDSEHSDLAAELAAELDVSLEEVLPVGPGNNAGNDFSVEDVFEEFKRGVDNNISDEDSDTHYDLGIAYREMGLMDDAITEFNVAMRSRDKEVLCHMMIGLCQAEKGLMSEAISQFKTGLYVEGITERETIALYFELGQAYEQLDDFREALYYYEKVNKKDPKFRDVASRIERLRRLGDGGNGAVGGGGGGHSGGGRSPGVSLREGDVDDLTV